MVVALTLLQQLLQDDNPLLKVGTFQDPGDNPKNVRELGCITSLDVACTSFSVELCEFPPNASDGVEPHQVNPSPVIGLRWGCCSRSFRH